MAPTLRNSCSCPGYGVRGIESRTLLFDARRIANRNFILRQAGVPSALYGLVCRRRPPPSTRGSRNAAIKLYAYWIVVNYRESRGMYACDDF